MAAISRVFTIRRAAQILHRNEDLLWELQEQFEPEDGLLWVYDIDDIEVPAFTDFGMENLRESSETRSTKLIECRRQSNHPAAVGVGLLIL